MLEAAKVLRRSRWGSGPTGAAALAAVYKVEASEAYDRRRSGSNPYVPMVAAQVAEPSRPSQSVDILEVLPPEQAAFYRREENVLQGGCVDAAFLAPADRRYKKDVGDLSQWREYLNREEVQPQWEWRLRAHITCTCAVACVPKRTKCSMRMVLAVVPANLRLGPPLRTKPLGLYGGAALSPDLVLRDRVGRAALELGNALAYCRVLLGWWGTKQRLPSSFGMRRLPSAASSEDCRDTRWSIRAARDRRWALPMPPTSPWGSRCSSTSHAEASDRSSRGRWPRGCYGWGCDDIMPMVRDIFGGCGAWTSVFERMGWDSLHQVDTRHGEHHDVWGPTLLRLFITVL